jgi:hypothetical protein
VPLLRKLFNLTLNNVVFGVALMVLIAAYIAIGSGVVSVREFFEMNELEFFDSWVLKTLMVLLCASLMVVTWNRIPLTPPRYGVWCIHSGIITLIMGTSLYYHKKIEGRTLVMTDHTAAYYYDTAERALYVRTPGSRETLVQPLPSLPRFNSYGPDLQNSARMQRNDLSNISAMHPLQGRELKEISETLGLKDKVRFDILGFYPYADVNSDVQEDPASNNTAVELKIDGSDGATAGSLLLSAAQPDTARQIVGVSEVEHRQLSPADLEIMKQAAANMLRLTISLPGKPDLTLEAQIGSEYFLPDTGYRLTIDSFNPQFPMFQTHEIVQALTIHVKSDAPAEKREFWRMILLGKDIQTDFKKDPANTPPMEKGNRQKEPLDPSLKLAFQFRDLGGLMPGEGQEKHTLITSGDHSLIDISTSFNRATEIKDLSNGGSINFNLDRKSLTARVRRIDHASVTARITEIPEAKREKEIAESGQRQVALVRVSSGNWQEMVPVPFHLYPIPEPETNEPVVEPWRMGYVHIPGAIMPLQLQLGNMYHVLPARLTLKKLDMQHYPGGQGETGLMRSISSTMVLTDRSTSEQTVAVCRLNDPIYYDGGKYLFFQAGYDPQGGWSLIGVGNRPGVTIMIIGCIMIVVGLLYAFYVKPIIISRMKAGALARAAAGKRSKAVLQTENVS